MKNKILLTIGIILFALICWCGTAKATTVTPAKQTIYAMEKDVQEEYNITIPSNYPQTYTIKVTGASGKPTFTPADSKARDALSVDANGKVTPKTQKTTIISPSGSTVREEYEYGTFKIKVTVDGQTLYAEVTIKDYAVEHAENILNNYVDTNIKNKNLTGKQKLDKICEYVAHTYDYSTEASGYVGMVLTGGGDCWASTSMIIYMCERLGITAYSRFAANDAGAGSGHRNAMAYVDGKYYELEAGYSMSQPRPYNVIERISEWDYQTKSDGTLKITQYDGKDTNLRVPEKINGKTVTEIGDQAFYHSTKSPTSIVLPNTITKIGNLAFYNCNNLTNITIPNSVKELDGAPFTGLSNINVTIASNHPYFTISDNIIYNKNKTKVIECLAKKTGHVTLPNTVATIGKSAFCRANITSITLPSTLKTLEDGAFRESKLTGITIPKSVTTIEQGAFYYTSNLKTCTIEEGCTASLLDYVFVGCSSLQEIEIPNTIRTINDNAFNNTKTVIIGKTGTTAQSYATKKGMTFQIAGQVKLGDINKDGKIDTKDARLALLAYVGKEQLTSTQVKAADVNKDNKVDTKDARQILLYYVGKIKNF